MYTLTTMMSVILLFFDLWSPLGDNIYISPLLWSILNNWFSLPDVIEYTIVEDLSASIAYNKYFI